MFIMEEEVNSQTGVGEDKRDLEAEDGLPVLRTFKSDSSRYIKEERVSAIDIVSAQAKKGTHLRYEKLEEEKKINWKSAVIAMIALTFLLVAGFGIFYFLKNWGLEKLGIVKETPAYVLPKPAIIADEEIEASVKEISGLIQGPLKTGRLLYVPIIKEESAGVKRLITAREFFDNFGIILPSDLIGDIDNQFMLYVYRSTENCPILIFEIKSYERVFTAMLRWENTSIAPDFKKIFSIGYESEIRPVFIDREIKNHDARVLNNKEGIPVLMYSILNNKYLIITTGQDALEEIFRRFSLPQYLSN